MVVLWCSGVTNVVEVLTVVSFGDILNAAQRLDIIKAVKRTCYSASKTVGLVGLGVGLYSLDR